MDNESLAYLTWEQLVTDWNNQDSLFAVFFGISDIVYTFEARTFVFLTLPTYWRPLDVINRGNSSLTVITKHRNLLLNVALADRFSVFEWAHAGELSAKLVDAYSLWENMYARPAEHSFRNVTEYCQAYCY
ncbi:hypothetical protein LTR85_003314 [Meristemomyces frigidus]|nr:hypothetical protein LTR85_003314 [Meristemomyces frigidus]